MENKIELLAGAGDIKIAKSLISAGCDAIYFGAHSFGARAYAVNFSPEEGARLLDYVHLHGKKAYLTVNTVLKDREMEDELFALLEHYDSYGIDAVLVADMGVAAMIREYFPQIAIHASTQMNVCSRYGASFLKAQGFSRVVTARELSIDEIKDIHRNCDIEIEAFVHGALCVCYSGQCLMSSFLGGRSGNRGRCAQPCRLEYEFFNSNEKGHCSRGYLLSPKDLCAIDHLPRLRDAGVCSFKIEGRMKQIEYAASVASVYRKYIDMMEANEEYTVSKEDMQILYDAGNRSGFTDKYFTLRSSSDMISRKSPAIRSNRDRAVLPKEKKLLLSARVIAGLNENIRLRIYGNGASAEVRGALCEPAKKSEVTAEDILKKLKRTGDTPFEFADTDIDADEGIFIPIGRINKLRRAGIDAYTRAALEAFHRGRPQKAFKRIEGSDVDALLSQGSKKVHLYARCTDSRQLEAIYSSGKFDFCFTALEVYEEFKSNNICADKGAAKGNRDTDIGRLKFIFGFSPIMRRSEVGDILDFIGTHRNALYEASSIDELGLLLENGIDAKNIYLGERLYALSNRTKLYYLNLGIINGCVPVELTLKELSHRQNVSDRIKIYGRMSLMYTAACMVSNSSGCKKKSGWHSLKDRKGRYMPVFTDCSRCMNVIFNSIPLCLWDKGKEIKGLAAGGCELSFTTENALEVREIIDKYSHNIIDFEYTRGHFTKGVE